MQFHLVLKVSRRTGLHGQERNLSPPPPLLSLQQGSEAAEPSEQRKSNLKRASFPKERPLPRYLGLAVCGKAVLGGTQGLASEAGMGMQYCDL